MLLIQGVHGGFEELPQGGPLVLHGRGQQSVLHTEQLGMEMNVLCLKTQYQKVQAIRNQEMQAYPPLEILSS